MSDPVFDTPTFASSIDPSSATPTADGPVTITDLSELAKVVVKEAGTPSSARSGGPGPRFGSSELVGEPSGDQVLVCGSRPGEWTVLGPPAAVAATVAKLDGETGGHVIDLTHGRALIEVAGPAAASVMEKVCSLDWSDDMMPDGAVTSASVAKVTCDVVRRDRDGQPAYLLAADRSFGQYLHDALVDATTEFTG